MKSATLNYKLRSREDSESNETSEESSEDEKDLESSEDEESKEEYENSSNSSDEISDTEQEDNSKHTKRRKKLKSKSTKARPFIKGSKKEKLFINIANTRYSAIKESGKELGFKITYKDEKDWDIMWHDCGITPDKLSRLQDYQRINHFPGMYILSRKNYLAINLMKM